eukprot:3843759-Prymnesium_polylepis.1
MRTNSTTTRANAARTNEVLRSTAAALDHRSRGSCRGSTPEASPIPWTSRPRPRPVRRGAPPHPHPRVSRGSRVAWRRAADRRPPCRA